MLFYKNTQEADIDCRSAIFGIKARIGGIIYQGASRFFLSCLGASLHEIQLKDGKVSYWSMNKTGRGAILFLHGFGHSKEGA